MANDTKEKGHTHERVTALSAIELSIDPLTASRLDHRREEFVPRSFSSKIFLL